MQLGEYIQSEEPKRLMNEVLVKRNLASLGDEIFSFIQEVFTGKWHIDEFIYSTLNELNPKGGDEYLLDTVMEVYDAVFGEYEDELPAWYENKKPLFKDAIAEVHKRVGLFADDARMLRRFEHICEMFWRGEYDFDRANRALTKGVVAGGLEIEEKRARAIMELLDEQLGFIRFENEVNTHPDDAQETSAEKVIKNVELETQTVPLEEQVRTEESKSEQVGEEKIVSTVKEVKDVDVIEVQTSSKVNKKNEPVKQEVASASTAKPSIFSQDAPKNEIDLARLYVDLHRIKAMKKEEKPLSSEIPVSQPKMDDKKSTEILEVENEVADVMQEDALITETEEQPADLSHDAQLITSAGLIIAKAKISFTDASIKKRLYDMVIARLKNIRGAYETRDAVMKPQENGGLGMSADDAQKFLAILENEHDALYATWREKEHKKKEEHVARKREEMFVKKESERAPLAHGGKTEDMVGIARAVKPQKREPIIAPHLKEMKPTMHDVQAVRPLTNPVSELSTYTIVDFRRIHSNPKEAILKIEGKISLLGRESFGDMKKGVAAWRQSEVMQVYREQLRQSVEGGMTLAQVIEKRKASELPFLTPEEIGAITLLSSKLRF